MQPPPLATSAAAPFRPRASPRSHSSSPRAGAAPRPTALVGMVLHRPLPAQQARLPLSIFMIPSWARSSSTLRGARSTSLRPTRAASPVATAHAPPHGRRTSATARRRPQWVLPAAWWAPRTRADGTTQVTYGGHPLYYFVGDKAAGDLTGQDINQFGAKWYVVGKDGKKIDTD